MFTLESSRLRLEIAEPGERPNTGFRFDRAGFIADVILDGGMHFGAAEPRNLIHPCSGGRGFCSEYRFDCSNEAEVGEFFPKFGVGLIRKEDCEKYIFYKKYREVKEFETKIHTSGQKAVFETEMPPCLGYGLTAKKTVSVSENAMTMEIEVHNTGEKEIAMEEFCHNFISIDGMAVGSDYQLEMPQIPDLGYERLPNRRGFSGAFRGNGHGLTFCEFTAIDTDTLIRGEDIKKKIPFCWRLLHKGARAYVEGEDYYHPAKIAVWGVDHMFCPEIVHGFLLKPGENHEWKRVWRFDMY